MKFTVRLPHPQFVLLYSDRPDLLSSGMPMRQLIQTNDPVLISFVEALLKDNDITVVVLDQNMSVLEGSIGILQRRVMVSEEDYAQSCRILRDAELDEWLKTDG